jgi:hypothetical protein
MAPISDRIISIHDSLDRADVPHAFGGALALAFCTERARGTIDIDVNVFLPASDAELVFDALPSGVEVTARSRADIARDGQARLWWEETPVDVFFDTTDFHRGAAHRARVRRFGERDVPFLACSDLAVFKAFFDRSRDWVDLEEMWKAGTVDVDAVLGTVISYLGSDDHRVARLRALPGPTDGTRPS